MIVAHHWYFLKRFYIDGDGVDTLKKVRKGKLLHSLMDQISVWLFPQVYTFNVTQLIGQEEVIVTAMPYAIQTGKILYSFV